MTIKDFFGKLHKKGKRMKRSWIKRVVALLVGTLVSSLLFLVVIMVTYNSFYAQSILGVNNGISANWASTVDGRLNTIYEHVYDLATLVFKKADVRKGSPDISFTIQNELQDSMTSKLMASTDITAIFIVDLQGDLYLYSTSKLVNAQTNYALKPFIKEYVTEKSNSVSNKEWALIQVADKSYYYKALSLGRYIVGAVCDCSNIAPPSVGDGEGPTFFARYADETFFCMGDESLGEFLDPERTGDYFQDGYAISTVSLYNSHIELIYATKAQGLNISWHVASAFLIVDSALCVILIALLSFHIDKNVRIPMKKLVKANEELSDGDLDYRLEVKDAGSSEFEELFGSFNEMSEKIGNLTIESYDLKIKREQNRLKMLRAQMQPHTFLNGITTISNMTYNKAPEEIRKYISDFAGFTRYMLHTATDWTTVEEELRHIDHYVGMQKLRFPHSIELTNDVPEEVQQSRIPYLILFSLVENSFKHAMTLVTTMHVTIRGEIYEEPGFKGIRLIEEDNGAGFTQEALDKLFAVENDELFTKEHLGLTNVRYSLKLIFNRDDLLRISNKAEGGAHVELLIPYGEYEDETIGM